MTTSTDERTVTARLERYDAHGWLTGTMTVLAVIGLAVAGAMAIWGLPDVDLHGPLHHRGIMDPFCGGTRSAYLTTQGDLAGAWTYNPLGILSVVGAALVALRTLVGLISGRWVNLHTRFAKGQRRALWAIAILGIVLLEIRQQTRADLLMETWPG